MCRSGVRLWLTRQAPPAVGTDLHREREDPDDNKKHKNPISLDIGEFMTEVIKGFEESRDLVTAGPGVKITERWEEFAMTDYRRAEGKK
jgi:hypothetical protein